MVFADWQAGQMFWSFLWFFMFFIWIWLLIMVFSDLFRDHSISGWAKAAWAIFVIVFPYLGILVYLIARGGSMGKRAAEQQAAAQQQFNSYVREVAGSSASSPADELARLSDLKSKGVISDAEFEQLKAKALA
jgi:hypothetical protein